TLEQKVFAETIDQTGQGSHGPARSPSPCPGGICSQGPTLPLAPAPDPVLLDQWGLLAAPGIFNGPETVTCTVGAEPEQPIGFPHSVFHPPRLHVSPFAL